MPKYISGRSKLRDPGKLTADRYRYLGLDQAEPNLGNPPDGTPPTGAIPSGERYQIVSIEGHPGERYWIPVEGGIIPGSFTIYDEGTLVGGINSTSQLNFVGAAISASSINTFKETTLTLRDSLTFSFTVGLGVTQKNSDAFGYVKASTTNAGVVTITNVTGSFTTNAADELFQDAVGIARTPLSKNAVINANVASSITVSPEFFSTNKQLIFNDNGEFNGASVYWDKTNTRLGINSSDPAHTLDVTGDIDVSGSIKVGATIYDSDGDPGLQGNILVKGAGTPGTIDWVRQESVISGAGGTIGNIQFHGTTGLVSGEDELNFNPYNEFIGIGTNDPAQKFQVGVDGKRYTTKRLNLSGAVGGSGYTAGQLVQLKDQDENSTDIFGTLVYDVDAVGTAITVRNSNYEVKGTQWNTFTGAGTTIWINGDNTEANINSVANDATIPETTYAGDDVFVVTNTGKVAIGTPNPFGDMDLSINGSASISAGSTFIIGDNVGITTHDTINGDDLIIETATPRLSLYSNQNQISEIKLLERVANYEDSKYGAFIRYDGGSPDPDNYLVIGNYDDNTEYKLIDAHIQNNTSRSLNFYNNNDLKFEVKNSGVKVTGNIEVTSGISDFQGDVRFDGDTDDRDIYFDRSEDSLYAYNNAQFRVGTDGDVRIYHDATRSYFGIDSGSSGNLTIGGTNTTTGFHTAIHVNYTSSPESSGVTTDFVNVELWHTSAIVGTSSTDGSKKFETIGAGVSVYDTAYIPNLITVGVATIDNIQIGHSGDNTIDTKSGNLILDSANGTVQVNDILYVNNTTESTNTTTGALRVGGGAGIVGDLNVGGAVISQYLDVTGIATIATLGVTGIATTKDLEVTGIATIATLGVTGIATTKDLEVTGIATIATLGVTGIATTKDFAVTGVSTIATLGVTGIATTKDLEVTGIATIATLGVTGLTTTKDLEVTGITTANDKEIYTKFDIENSSSSAYTFKSTGIGFTQNQDNPDIYLNRGQNYRFDVDASGHPFWIKTINSAGIGNSYNDGVIGNGIEVGIITFKVPFNSPDTLYYNCQNHLAMNGKIYLDGGGGSNPDWEYTKGQFTASFGNTVDIDTFDYTTNDYKTTEYILHFEDPVGNIQACKCFIMQNNTTAFIQEYAVMFDPNRIVNLTTTISGNDVKLRATAQTGITGIVTYRFNRGIML